MTTTTDRVKGRKRSRKGVERLEERQGGQDEPRLVLVEWEDSFGCASTWEDLSVEAPSPLLCRSTGWLVHADDKCHVIKELIGMAGKLDA